MCSSYVVLIGVSLVLLLEQGTIKSLGVFLPQLQEQFVTATWVIGLAISFTPGIGSLACLLILPILGNGDVINPSTVLIICGIISGLGLIIASLTSEVVALVFALTLEGSLAVAKVVAFGTLTKYYKDSIELVTAIAGSAQSLGVMIMPPVAQIFLDTYGWRGGILLLGGLEYHIIVVGMIIRYNEYLHRDMYSPIVEETWLDNGSFCKQCCSYLSGLFNFSLLSNVRFINVLLQASASGWAYTSWMIYLVPHAEEKGIAVANAVFLATLGGTGNFIGKLCCPVVTKFIPRKIMIVVSLMLAGLSISLDPLFGSMIGMGISSTMFALLTGLAFIASMSSISEVVPEKQAYDAYAWFYLLYGVNSMAGGFVTGLLFDVTGSYDISFVVMGALITIPGITLGIEDFCITNAR